jgi:hypothetical protein
MDPPARLLATAVASLPADRADWGAAMTAELDQVRGRGARWWFAAGCARTAMFPPRGNRLPVLVVAALATAASVGRSLRVGVQPFGVFGAAIGSARWRRRRPQPDVQPTPL